MWDSQSLYNKARAFVRKGLEEESTNSPWLPLWCIFALELLAKASLARTNPALLADPQDDENILFACGFPGEKAPMSIPAKTLFQRCVVVCEDFFPQDFELCMQWLHVRNKELHSGALLLEKLDCNAWLPEFFRVCDILLRHNGTDLEDFVGARHAIRATGMHNALMARKASRTRRLVQERGCAFRARDRAEQCAKQREGDRLLSAHVLKWKLHSKVREVPCPACQGAALIMGNPLRSATPTEDGKLTRDNPCRPETLKCFSCDLELLDHADLEALGLGGQFRAEPLPLSRPATLGPSGGESPGFDPRERIAKSG